MQTQTLNLKTPQDIYARTAGAHADLADWAALLGRIGLALIFLWSGYGKLTDIAGTVASMTAHHIPMAGMLVWPAALLEVFGAAMLLSGWKAGWGALALAAYTMLAAVIFHNFWAMPPDQVMGQTISFMKNVAITGGLLQVFAFGAGRYAVDR